MGRLSIGVCLTDKEYEKRLCAILFKYYRKQFEVHVFSNEDMIREKIPEVMLVDEGFDFSLESLDAGRNPFFCLCERKGEFVRDTSGREVVYMEKYQEVSALMDAIMHQIGCEIAEIQGDDFRGIRAELLGVYGLCENELQLPFALTYASILAEQQHVLLLDLQENSGLSQFMDRVPIETPTSGLEELLLMAKRGNIKRERIIEMIGHQDKYDYVYPVVNTEVLCEADAAMYADLLQFLRSELDYGVIVINFGTRFQGFFDALNQCRQVFLMQRQGGMARWREAEFVLELERRGYDELEARMVRIETPIISNQSTDLTRLVELWKWNDFGDYIRRLAQRGSVIGSVGY